MFQDQGTGDSRIRMCGQSESNAVGRRLWSLVGCAVSNEGSCSIAAICESSTSEAGGLEQGWRAFGWSLAVVD